MKGIIFTEFMEFAEKSYGLETVDEILDSSGSQGAYTAIGTYPPAELVGMFVSLGEKSGTPVPELLVAFGKWLFGSLAKAYPQYTAQVGSTFELLSQIENHIHVEVLKLYPDAELPEFEHEFSDPNTMLLTYQSARGLGDLAYGLILACVEKFGEEMDVEQIDLSDGQKTRVQFKITRRIGE